MKKNNKKAKLALLKVSILAIRADGNISSVEADKLKDLLAEFELDKQEVASIDKCWTGSASISDITDEVIELGLEREAFQRAALILLSEGMNQREHEFLREFGDFLNLDEQECSRLFKEVAESYEANVVISDEPDSEPPAVQDLEPFILKYATWAGSIGLTPIPVVSDFLVLTPLQMKMVYEIGKSYGHELDKQSLKEFSTLLGVAFGLKVVGSIMKMIPVIGVLGSAAVAFSGTYAMGKTAEVYFKRGRHMEKDEIRKLYKAFVEEGKKLYKVVEEKVKSVDVAEIKRKFTK